MAATGTELRKLASSKMPGLVTFLDWFRRILPDLGNLEPLKPGRRSEPPALPSPAEPHPANHCAHSRAICLVLACLTARRPSNAPQRRSLLPHQPAPPFTDRPPDFPPGATASRMYSQRPLSRVPSQTSALPARARNARSLPNSRPYLICRRRL